MLLQIAVVVFGLSVSALWCDVVEDVLWCWSRSWLGTFLSLPKAAQSMAVG